MSRPELLLQQAQNIRVDSNHFNGNYPICDKPRVERQSILTVRSFE